MEVLSLGEKIKKRRKELDMTLKDVAGERVTPGQISLVESGKSNPSMDLLEYLADTLDISVEYFMESEITQADIICKYYSRMAEINLNHGNLEKALEFIDKADAFVDKYGLTIAKARNLFLRGVYKVKVKSFEEAYDYMFKCNLIYSNHDYYEGFIENFMYVGKSFIETDSIPLAISYFHKCEALFREGIITDELMLGKVYYYLAVGYQHIGRSDKAKEYTKLATDKFAKLNDKIGYGNLLTALAEDYEAKGNLKEALTYSSMALGLFKEFDAEKEYGEIEHNLGKLYIDFEDFDEAVLHFIRAKDVYSKSNDYRLNQVFLSLAECYVFLDRQSDCIDTLNYLDKVIPEEDVPGNIALFRLKAKVYGVIGNKKESLNNMILAANLAKTRGYKEQESEILIMMAKFHLDNGKDEESMKFLDSSIDLMNEIGEVN